MVEKVCGVPQDVFATVCRLFVENSGRERTTAFVHGVGWTQHTIGSQYIRAASVLQLLLGNMGRPGGGVMAMRGHASIQGSSDIPTLFDTLPGYIPMPHAHGHGGLDDFVEADSPSRGYWGNMRDYLVSLLKAWWGDAATEDNEYCFNHLPRLTGSHSTYDTTMAMVEGKVKGFFLFGQNPAVGSANVRMQRLGMSKLDWLVVRDFSLIESATWWKDGPEIESGEMRTEDIDTEVFFLPAAAHTEKEGTFTNTQRMLQWHHKAVEPIEEQRSDLWFTYHLGRKIRERLAGSEEERDRPILDLTWDYPTEGPHEEPSADAVLRGDQRLRTPTAKMLSAYTELKADGSTSCGCWIYCGCYADGVNQTARRKPKEEQNWTGGEWAWAWPANRRILYNRASADPAGKPWSERKKLVWWDEAKGEWTGLDTPDFEPDQAARLRPRRGRRRPRRDCAATSRSSCSPTGAAGSSPRPASPTARCRPTTSRRTRRSATCSTSTSATRRANSTSTSGTAITPTPTRPGADVFPYRRHHLPADRALHRRRDVPLDALPGRAAAGVLRRGLAGAGGRARARALRLGDDRQRPRRGRGAGDGDRPDDAAPDRRADHPPDRHALPLGAERDRPRGLDERAVLDGARPELPHPGGEGALGRRRAGTPPARAGADRAGRGVPTARRDHRGDGG